MSTITEEQYFNAFHACAKKITVRGKILDAHMQFLQPNGMHVATATELASAVHYPNHNSINLQYGLFARTIGEHLGITPDYATPGSTDWLSIFVVFYVNGGNPLGHCELELRPEVARAWTRFKAAA